MITCKDCPRHKDCTNPTRPEVKRYSGDGAVRVFILGESPGVEEDKVGRPFVGRTGTVILRPILATGVKDYILDNSVRCFSPHKPKPKELEACSKYWKAEVAKHKPDVVLALGAYAAEAVLGKKVAITDYVGTAVMLTVNGRKYPVLLNYHPSYILRQKGKKGGEHERIIASWQNTWNAIPEIVVDGVAKPPKTVALTKTKEIIGFLKMVLNDYSEERMAETGETFTYDYEAAGGEGENALRPDLCRQYSVLSVGMGLGVDGDERGIAFPFDTMDGRVDHRIESLWKRIISVPGGVAQNAKFEHKVNLKRFGVTATLNDTMLAMNTVHELSRADLGSIAHYCKIPWASYKILLQETQKNPADAPLEQLLEYSGLEGLATHISWHRLYRRVDADGRLNILRMKQQFAMYLARAEMNGMHINSSEVAAVKRQLMRELLRAEKEFRNTKQVKKTEQWSVDNIKSFKDGDAFNPRSPKQMQYLCLNLLKLPIKPSKYKWKDGKRVAGTISLDKTALEKFEETHPVVKHLNKVRSIRSMFSGFLDKWNQYVGPDNCVHTNYTQVVVVTGRLSSTEPNLQNVPTDSPVRRVFNSRYDGGWVIAPDYSQLEPRILAGWSRDKEMCRALNGGLDLHRFVAAMIYSVDYDNVTPHQRWIAKRRNLGSMYGQTAEGLADMCNISLDEAKEIVAIYNAKFPGASQFRLSKHKEAIRYGMVKDLFGSVRHLPDAQSKDRVLMERALRQAGNFPIQSTGNTFHLIALCVLFRLFDKNRTRAVVMGPEHDKIYVDSSNEAIEESMGHIKTAMLIHNKQDYWRDMPVPMKVDIKYGRNLHEMYKYE